MKLFFDTCTVVEYLCNRKDALYVEQILDSVEQKGWDCFISIGSFYTLIYLIELHLKRNGLIDKEERINRLREMLSEILDTFVISDIYERDLIDSIHDEHFFDLEDSCQYRAALASECDYLITINVKDFKIVDSSKPEVLTPSEFCKKMFR